MTSPGGSRFYRWGLSVVGWITSAVGVVIVVLVLTASSGPPRPSGAGAGALQPAPAKPGVAKGSLPLFMTRSVPVSLHIPAIGMTTTIISVGLTAEHAVAVPPLDQVGTHEAAWYDLGPSPGEIGTAIIVAHVDSYLGAGVFYELGLLRPGDTIIVGRADRSTAVYTVTGARLYPKATFPGSHVYGQATDSSQLRLITCGGPFDYQTRHYLDNTVVYATLTSVSDPAISKESP